MISTSSSPATVYATGNARLPTCTKEHEKDNTEWRDAAMEHIFLSRRVTFTLW